MSLSYAELEALARRLRDSAERILDFPGDRHARIDARMVIARFDREFSEVSKQQDGVTQ